MMSVYDDPDLALRVDYVQELVYTTCISDSRWARDDDCEFVEVSSHNTIYRRKIHRLWFRAHTTLCCCQRSATFVVHESRQFGVVQYRFVRKIVWILIFFVIVLRHVPFSNARDCRIDIFARSWCGRVNVFTTCIVSSTCVLNTIKNHVERKSCQGITICNCNSSHMLERSRELDKSKTDVLQSDGTKLRHK